MTALTAGRGAHGRSVPPARNLAALGLLLVGIPLVLLPFLGPAVVLLGAFALGVLALGVRYPILALLVPLVVAPVAFTTVPGTGGLRVIHIAVMVAVSGVALGYVMGRYRVLPPPVIAFGALLGAALCLSTLTSLSPIDSFKVTLGHLLGLFLAGAAGVLVRQSRANLEWILRGWIAASLVVILPAVPAASQATEMYSGAIIEGRVQGVFSQPNDFGEFALYALAMSWALLMAARRRTDKLLAWAGLAAGLVGISVSFSRGVWAGAAVMVVMVCILVPRLIKPLAAMAAAVGAAIFVFGSAGIPPFSLLLGRLVAMVSGNSVNPEDDRGVIHTQAIRLLTENPLVGSGPGTFQEASYQPGAELFRHPYLHGHSVPLTVGAEAGLLGLVALGLLTVAMAFVFFRALFVLRRAGRTRDAARLTVLAAGMVAICVHGLIDFVYTNPYLIPLLWFQLGILAGMASWATDRFGDQGDGVDDVGADRIDGVRVGVGGAR